MVRVPIILSQGRIFLALTAYSTIGLGEHYYVDLIVAVPFVLGVQKLAEMMEKREQRKAQSN